MAPAHYARFVKFPGLALNEARMVKMIPSRIDKPLDASTIDTVCGSWFKEEINNKKAGLLLFLGYALIVVFVCCSCV